MLLVIVVVVSAGTAAANQGESPSREIGINAASAGLTLLYAPVKMTYSALGLVFGGIAYGLSGGDSDVLSAVVTPAVYGDYAVFPSHLRGQQKLEFIGRDPAYREQKVVDTTIVEEVY